MLSMPFLVVACGASSAPAPTSTPLSLGTIPPSPSFTVALATDVGGLGDRSFNQLSWRGLENAAKQLGIKIKNKQSRTERAYEPTLRSFAQSRPALIIAVGYSMSRAVFDVAQQYPQQRFAMVDARPIDLSGRETSLANVDNILFREEESGYLAGTMAGLMEKDRIGASTHNTIGYLGGKQIPGVTHYLAGYVAGAEKADPSVRVLGRYAQTFVNARLGRRFGVDQIAKGADILFQVAAQTGGGYLSAAQQKHVYGIGADIDQSYLGPFVITSALKHVDIAVEEVIRSTLRGSFQSGDERFGISRRATGIAPISSLVPHSIVLRVATVQRQLQKGTLAPPQSIPAR
jgi:basic membrane protein A